MSEEDIEHTTLGVIEMRVEEGRNLCAYLLMMPDAWNLPKVFLGSMSARVARENPKLQEKFEELVKESMKAIIVGSGMASEDEFRMSEALDKETAKRAWTDPEFRELLAKPAEQLVDDPAALFEKLMARKEE